MDEQQVETETVIGTKQRHDEALTRFLLMVQWQPSIPKESSHHC